MKIDISPSFYRSQKGGRYFLSFSFTGNDSGPSFQTGFNCVRKRFMSCWNGSFSWVAIRTILSTLSAAFSMQGRGCWYQML